MEAYEYIEKVQQQRDEIAQEIRKFRNMVREHKPGESVRKYNAVLWHTYIYGAPKSISVSSLEKQLMDYAYSGSRSIPNLTSFSGYSHCGTEDYIGEKIDEARKHAHFLLDVLMAKLSEQD